MAQAMEAGAADPAEEVLVAAEGAVAAPEDDSTIIYGKNYTNAANWRARWQSLAG